jgi:hypothetical protein
LLTTLDTCAAYCSAWARVETEVLPKLTFTPAMMAFGARPIGVPLAPVALISPDVVVP